MPACRDMFSHVLACFNRVFASWHASAISPCALCEPFFRLPRAWCCLCLRVPIMSGVDGREDDINEMLHRIESLVAARTEQGNTKQQLMALEADLAEREDALAERERQLVAREAAVATREEAVARREGRAQITPPPPPVTRALCETCHVGVCSRNSVCFDRWNRDMHTHTCTACHQQWKRTGVKGHGRGKR